MILIILTFWTWSCWPAIAAISAFLSVIVAAAYTCFTYSLLKTSYETLNTNNKLAEYQIYNEIAKTLYHSDVQDYILKIKNASPLITNELDRRFIRNKILNNIEDLAKFMEDGLISIEGINTGFGSMILLVGNNNEIKDLIRNEKQLFPDVFIGFIDLYSKIYIETSDQEKANYTSVVL
jgi:hypothetical protein